MTVETKYKKGDTIYWYCDTDDEVHHAEVQFVNYIPVGFPEINYEVETICCGERRTLFISVRHISLRYDNSVRTRNKSVSYSIILCFSPVEHQF